ncbi:uncharacterized protein EV422DRAFT_549908 [Fimicolochytrium jonesii]|uniref:uncharacterized protein n=1 Tax=Fimicolochytrium jonesii TaxID=1396493 RepID=UPI0022FF1DD7|nr:uncharacterized protein EV422DRAFT_549908 [Fimicolochytrium jonesii]KAI8825189.1 hypothetical protein EV422DRAFT_549908 [Fimicolochytrium jonesii]
MTLPDFMVDPDAVLKDVDVEWRNKRAPDYKKVNQAWVDERSVVHEEGSLPWLVQNLVKNWEKEVSYKSNPAQWRTVDLTSFTFQTNGGPVMDLAAFSQTGSYNALIGESELYSSTHSDFIESHKTFKRALRTFSWEVLEVYSGPPVVAFKWRHWGTSVGKFKSITRDGRKIEADPVNKVVAVFGVTVAEVTEDFRIKRLETFYDPSELIAQLTREYRKALKEATEAMAKCPFFNGAKTEQ